MSRSQGGGRRSYNVELVSIDLVGAPGADLKEEAEGRRQEAGGCKSYNVGLVPPDLVCDPRRI